MYNAFDGVIYVVKLSLYRKLLTFGADTQGCAEYCESLSSGVLNVSRGGGVTVWF